MKFLAQNPVKKAVTVNMDNSKGKVFRSKLQDDMTLEEMARKHKIVGTCTNLEKPYFRLGADPDPAKVRPEHVLKQSLKMLKNKWKKKDVEYRYMEDQFKSIRQDLIVQGIK